MKIFGFGGAGAFMDCCHRDCDNVDYREAENGARGSDSFTNGNYVWCSGSALHTFGDFPHNYATKGGYVPPF